MSTKGDLLELPGLRVTVDRVDYNPEAQTPPDRPHGAGPARTGLPGRTARARPQPWH